MSTITREDVRALLGEIEDLDAARIVGTGASLDELKEAVREVETEDEMGEPAPPPSSPRVTELRGLLEEILGPELEPDDEPA